MTKGWMRRVSFFKRALEGFLSSPHPFSVIHSVHPIVKSFEPTRTLPLYILDSSFNPPTVAHLKLLLAALIPHSTITPQRLLLLLATQNADKPLCFAPLEHRLSMMECFAMDLCAHLSGVEHVSVDLGVTKHPYFVDKAKAIEASNTYTGAEQVHLVGFDTLTRICDARYYPPTNSLAVLGPFLEKHRLHVTSRVGEDSNAENEQKNYVRAIAEGALDAVGGRREWVTDGRIQLDSGSEGTVSSTRVREAVRCNDWEALERLTTPHVREWILTAKRVGFLEYSEKW